MMSKTAAVLVFFWTAILAQTIFVTLASLTGNPAVNVDPGVSSQPPCQDTSCKNSSSNIVYLLVSTLNGQVSALDVNQNGSLRWSVPVGARPLYSSSLASMEITQNGKRTRLIPALDGALYQFDGDTVEAVPFSAESLLSSSVKLNGDSMIVGRKESSNLAIRSLTGQIQFSCSSERCDSFESTSKNHSLEGGQSLLLTRTTHTVRSVDLKFGQEKWNFSVGQHQISSLGAVDPTQTDDRQGRSQGDSSAGDKTWGEQFTDLKGRLNISVPEGRIVAIDKDDSTNISWEHQFDSPIAKVWVLADNKLEEMNLFEGHHTPTLKTYISHEQNDSLNQPFLYIGSHQKLLYIQASPHLESLLRRLTSPRFTAGHLDLDLKVLWRPYLNTASFRTPILGGNRPELTIHRQSPASFGKQESSALSVWQDHYPFDGGYYLYPEFSDRRSLQCRPHVLFEDFKSLMAENGQRLHGSFLSYWKEVMLLSMTAAVCFHLFLARIFVGGRGQHSKSGEHETRSSGEGHSAVMAATSGSQSVDNSLGGSYMSRFATDFKCLQRLSSNSYDVVFEAVNVVDDQHYAVKRIELPESDTVKEKILKEVKLLARLDHVGIVRYFNAWVETSLVDRWQEQQLDEPTCLRCTDQCFGTSPLEKNKHRPASSTQYTAHNSSDGWPLPETMANHSKKNNNSVLSHSYSTPSVHHSNNHQWCNLDKVTVDVPNSGADANVRKTPSSSANRMNSYPELSHLPSSSSGQFRLQCFLYVQMQLLPKESLKCWLTANPVHRSQNKVCHIFSQILCAVEYIHSQGLVHKDLQPSNIFFINEETVRIGDFGQDYKLCHRGKCSEDVVTTLYMSPELIAKETCSSATDIFSLGFILMELLVPATTPTEHANLLQKARCQIFPPQLLDLALESELVCSMTNSDPSLRPSASDILNHPVFFNVSSISSIRSRNSRRTLSCRSTSSSDVELTS